MKKFMIAFVLLITTAYAQNTGTLNTTPNPSTNSTIPGGSGSNSAGSTLPTTTTGNTNTGMGTNATTTTGTNSLERPANIGNRTNNTTRGTGATGAATTCVSSGRSYNSNDIGYNDCVRTNGRR